MAPSLLLPNDGNVMLKPDLPSSTDNASQTKDSITTSDPTSSAVLHRDLHHGPLKVVAAKGNYLTLEDVFYKDAEDGPQPATISQDPIPGRTLTSRSPHSDATGGAAVACIGHGDPSVKEAVVQQMDEVSYCHSLFFSSSGAENLAKDLIDSTNGVMARAFIVSSGSEAMEAAIKLARQYFLELGQPARTRFIARSESYHGTTLGALSMSGHLGRRKLFEPMLLDNVSRVSACNAYRGMRDGENTEGYVGRLAQELDDEFERVGSGSVCAFVAEPVVGAALGCVPAVSGYFRAMKAVCDKHGALLVLDEVMCGMGRTGSMHAWQQEDVTPDIQTIGKGLGGGYAPIAALLISPRIIAALSHGSGSFLHGQTYQGHPVACAAAHRVQTILRTQNLIPHAARMSVLLARGLHAGLDRHPHVGDIRGRGLFWGIEFVEDKRAKRAFAPERGVAWRVHEKGMAEGWGISLYPGQGTVDGVAGDHVLLAPAYNVTEGEVEWVVRQTVGVVEEVFAEMSREQRREA
ncbi:hypothetical protein MMC34_002040 [Xylographa carneopallida]|nr:hypothetical protein [Xylographa carneopallida]